MAEITLTNSNSDNVAGLASTNFLARVRVLCFEHALNLLDVATTPTPTAAQTTWAYDVLDGIDVNFVAIGTALAVYGNPASVGDIDNATDAVIRGALDTIIERCITAWVDHNPASV